MPETENLCVWCDKSKEDGAHSAERQLVGSHCFESYSSVGEAQIRKFEEDVMALAYKLKVERAARKIVGD